MMQITNEMWNKHSKVSSHAKIIGGDKWTSDFKLLILLSSEHMIFAGCFLIIYETIQHFFGFRI